MISSFWILLGWWACGFGSETEMNAVTCDDVHCERGLFQKRSKTDYVSAIMEESNESLTAEKQEENNLRQENGTIVLAQNKGLQKVEENAVSGKKKVSGLHLGC